MLDVTSSDPLVTETAPLTGNSPGIGGSCSPRFFGLALATVTASALALRVVYVLTVTRHQNGTLYDSFWYYSTTIGLHSGQFFREPFSFNPTATHPPMTTLFLGGPATSSGCTEERRPCCSPWPGWGPRSFSVLACSAGPWPDHGWV